MTATAERRRAPRRQPALGTVCRLEAEIADLPVGLVWNISSGGISLLFPKPLPAGTALTGKLSAMNRSEVLNVAMHVCHVSKLATGDYVLGCQFERPVAFEELRPFLAESSTPA